MTGSDRTDHVAVTIGDGLALVTPTTLAVLETGNGELAERLWAQVSGGAGVDELLEELSATGLRSLGSFALAQLEGQAVRLVVRGAAAAWVSSEPRGMTCVGAGAVKTWVEHVEPGADRVALSLGGDEIGPSLYRISTGLLPATGLLWPCTDLAEGELARAEANDFADFEPPLAPRPVDASPVVAEAVVGTSTAPLTGGAELEDGVALVQPVPPDHVGVDAEDDGADGAPEPPAHPSEETAFESGDTVHLGKYVESEPLDVDDSAELDDYDELFGRTVHRSVQGAAVQRSEDTEDTAASGTGLISAVPPGAPSPGNEPNRESTTHDEDGAQRDDDVLGDHDGLTISVAQLRAMRGAAVPAATGPVGGPVVHALVCPSGHPNPTHVDACRTCGSTLTDGPVTIARPTLGRIRFSSGDLVELDRSALIGRNPKVEGHLLGELPQTVRLDGGQALSRSHVMVKLEGWQVFVEDLGSANGTTVSLPGQAPRRLRAGEPFLVEDGASIDLGGEIVGTFEANR